MSSASAGPGAAGPEILARRIRLLVSATISWNLMETGVAIAAGAAASSAALIGFGLDSLIEVSSAAAVAWQFAAREHRQREARERAALRVIAVSFFALAAFVGADAVRALAGSGLPRPSLAGVILAAAPLVVMPVLSGLQRRAGRRLGSASAVADSRQALLCTGLSGVLLLGLAANAALSWSWADPAGGTHLYRAVDQDGQVIDVLLSARRDLAAARRFFTRALRAGTVPAEVSTDRAAACPRVLDQLIPSALHTVERYANKPVETDHGRLKARLRPMRGLKRHRSARIISAGHAFVQNLRRDHYELATDVPARQRIRDAFDQLATAI
jgi:hypothetical protein